MAETWSDTYVVKFPRPVRLASLNPVKHLFYDDVSFVADMALYRGATVTPVSNDDAGDANPE